MTHDEETRPDSLPSEGGGGPEPRLIALVFLLGPLVMGGVLVTVILRHRLEVSPLAIGLLVGLVLSVIAFAVTYALFRRA